MRTIIITLSSALVFLAAHQIAAAPTGPDPGKSGASQAVVSGSIQCFPDGGLNTVGMSVEAGLGAGLGAISQGTLAVAKNQSEDCSELIPALAEQVPHPICEIGSSPHQATELFGFVCTGHADAVISAVGKMARTVIRLGQP
jgi:hypothetical protein